MKRIQLRTVFLAVTALGLLVWGAAVIIPHTFNNGDVISAADMNASFTAVKSAVDANESAVASLRKGPTVHYVEAGPGSVAADGNTNLCQTTAYTAGANERALVTAQLSLSASSSATFTGRPMVSQDGGTTFAPTNSWFTPSTIPAAGWSSTTTGQAVDLVQGNSYVFAITPLTIGSAFTATDSRCHVMAQIVPRDSAQTLAVQTLSGGDER